MPWFAIFDEAESLQPGRGPQHWGSRFWVEAGLGVWVLGFKVESAQFKVELRVEGFCGSRKFST